MIRSPYYEFVYVSLYKLTVWRAESYSKSGGLRNGKERILFLFFFVFILFSLSSSAKSFAEFTFLYKVIKGRDKKLIFARVTGRVDHPTHPHRPPKRNSDTAHSLKGKDLLLLCNILLIWACKKSYLYILV